MTSRNSYLRRVYGITEEQYLEILHKQGGGCAICAARTSTRSGKRLSVDHNHRTGEIRGLLCFKCNHLLVGRHTDPEPLERAGRYLRGPYTGLFVPPKKKRKKRKRRTR